MANYHLSQKSTLKKNAHRAHRAQLKLFQFGSFIFKWISYHHIIILYHLDVWRSSKLLLLFDLCLPACSFELNASFKPGQTPTVSLCNKANTFFSSCAFGLPLAIDKCQEGMFCTSSSHSCPISFQTILSMGLWFAQMFECWNSWKVYTEEAAEWYLSWSINLDIIWYNYPFWCFGYFCEQFRPILIYLF
jgi:hypothetical protein